MRNRIFEERDDYGFLIQLAEDMKARGSRDSEIRKAILKASGIARSTLHQAEQRGSIPALPPRDPARAAAKKVGETRCFGNPCDTHGDVGRWTADGRCCACALNYNRAWKDAD